MKIILITPLLILSLLFLQEASAHSGRTDRYTVGMQEASPITITTGQILGQSKRFQSSLNPPDFP